ncbi:ROK family protein [Akkermansiaceae bacterium]|nr:ROK family protein [Akkermansiaceae bacterium]
MADTQSAKRVLVIDVGGTNIKIITTGAEKRIKIPSGENLTAERMVSSVKEAVEEAGWEYDVISLGVPCVVRHDRITRTPHNLGTGWVDFNFSDAFNCPVKMINDAALQAYGCYQDGRMLFLGFGTGLGTSLIIDGFIVPLECGHLPYDQTENSLEDYVGKAGRKRLGDDEWLNHSLRIIKSLRHAFSATDLVIGGGNAEDILPLPENTRVVDNSAAFTGGFRLWDGSF